MNCKPPTIRHAYLEEYEVAAAIAVKCYQQFENQIAPGLWPVMKDWIVNTTNLKNGGELLIAAKHESIVGSIVYYPPNLESHRFFSNKLWLCRSTHCSARSKKERDCKFTFEGLLRVS
jgi:hypothetical protein